MTTIAFDGHEMAADSLSVSDGSMKWDNIVKIFKTDDFIVAFAGSLDNGYQYLDILKGELKIKDASIDKNFAALVWHSDGRVEEIYSSLYPIPVTWKYSALGSGAAYAMAAMYCGKTAREAIEIAKKLDSQTGGKVISYSWDKITRKKGKKKKNEMSTMSNGVLSEETLAEVLPS